MSFNGKYVLNVILFAAQQGVKSRELFELVGKSVEELSAETCKVETAAYNAMVSHAVESSGDVHLGLHAGEFMNLSAAGLVLQIMRTSRTIAEAVRYACEFSNLGCSHLPLKMIPEGDQIHIRVGQNPLWWAESPLAMRTTLDGLLAFNLRILRTLTLNSNPEIRVSYGLPKPHDKEEYQRVFSAPVTWEAKETQLTLPGAELDRVVISRDFGLLSVLVAHAREKLAYLEKREGFADQVRRTILNLLNPDFPGLETTAANLNLSVRSLQRRLKEEGHTYRDLVEELRHQFALSHLRNPELSISEIAYQLGYSDPAGFVRAFRRHTGKTPAVFRKEDLN